MDQLTDLDGVIRRVVAARVSDRHLVEDLTQETLVRVAASAGLLTPDAQRAYAIVTARNIVVSHARSEAVHHRHAHRLVDYKHLDGPEQLALEQEETEALAAALSRIDPEDRRLLLEHEVDGVATDRMALDAGVSRTAMSMRLARARATLRVEFLLIFRRVELPTTKCRHVLQALSAGDRRRQAALDAPRHLLRCQTCAELARPATERRRGIAAWLIVPGLEVLRRAWGAIRRSGRTQAVAAVAAIAATAAVIAVVATRSDDGVPAADPAPAAAQAPTSARQVASAPLAGAAGVTPPASTDPPATLSATASTDSAVGTTAPIVPASTAPSSTACPPPVVLDDLSAGLSAGCSFAPSTVTVVDVPADEGFWVATAAGRSVWVELVGDGESPIGVVAGAELTITGVLGDPAVAPPPIDDALGDLAHVVQVGYDEITTS
ncbi:MAG: sigma-70 family RNA polymerase sigma factor [Ilumatobacteraceae bacterium]